VHFKCAGKWIHVQVVWTKFLWRWSSQWTGVHGT